MINKPTLFPLDFQWPTFGPFLFCVHHLDHFPKGNASQGLDPIHFEGRNLGSDFSPKNGFRLYHGKEIPGFPVHPHRGFETITIVRKGLVDHADSLGASGRYGQGDVQWMTAGSGVQHSEMFPLVYQDRENTVELFQIWLNLPARNKMASPHFTMMWNHDIPVIKMNKSTISLIAGEWNDSKALTPPPNSWAQDSGNEVMIALITIAPGESIVLPKTKNIVSKTLYFYKGAKAMVAGESLSYPMGFHQVTDSEILIVGDKEKDTEFLYLQAKEIGEPVVQHGPFVMNSREEILKTFEDYRQTEFGGWSWGRQDFHHGKDPARFAKYPDGKLERPKS